MIIIESYTKYRDGGTFEVKTNIGTFCFDFRIKTETPGELYLGYPKEDNSNLIKDEDL